MNVFADYIDQNSESNWGIQTSSSRL